MKKIFFVLLLVLSSWVINAQLVVNNTSQTPQQLAQNVLLGQGVNISNIKFNGSVVNANSINDQIGQFSNGSTTNIGINNGLILSTGNAIIAKGSNDRSLATLPTSNPFEGDADLSILTNNQTIKNVAILEFDFTPVGNKLSFNFVFASDEYPEFVNDSYNDNFGFFLSGPGIIGPFSGNAQNIALIPSTTLPVSINNLNNGNSNTGPCEYCSYYVDNEGGATIQYDGFTTLLTASADVQCGQTYHIKLAIANVGDNNYDSAVFIQGASFSSSGINLGADLKLCSVSNHTLNTKLSTGLIHEWIKDGIILSGETSPNLTVTQSGNYTVTAYPYGASCPVTDVIKVEFNTQNTPLITCGVITTNSIQFNWESLIGVNDYSVSYQINSDSPVNIGSIGNVTSYTVDGLNSDENVTITITPTGTPIDCYAPSSQFCSSTNCIAPTLTLTQGSTSQSGCVNNSISDIVFNIGGGATTASITSGSLPPGVIGNLNGNTFTISGIPSSSGLFNFTVSTLGGCIPNVALTGSLNIHAGITPRFNPITPICVGETLTALPLLSNNNISGTWSPALNNQATTEYTFIPNTGQCANSNQLTIHVNSKITPSFTQIAPICVGETLTVLPLLSNNNISGTWSPALNNQVTTEYTFIPNTGQCANSNKLTIDVNSKITPTFTAINPICIGETLNALPSLSNNNISGTWSPALNNRVTTEYTFTPNTNQCANSNKLTIDVNSKITPTFTAINPICIGETLTDLPFLSNNNISGTWFPALNNQQTTEYSFIPNTGQCANSSKLIIDVNSKITPTFTAINPICIGEILTALPLVSNNNISGTWSPALNNQQTTEYIFTPNTNKCTNTIKQTITVHSKPTPLLLNGIICLDKNTNAIIQSYTLDSKLKTADYNFEWFLNGNKINNAIESTLETTEQGIYSVIASNKTTNCSSLPTEATVTETFSNSTTFEIKQTNGFDDDATITVVILQGNGNYEYQLDNGTFQTSSIFSKISSGAHIINIRDTSGCTNLSKEIVVLGYPKFFTPNNDGHNDTWNIIGFKPQSNPVIYIFDRYGKLLKQISSTTLGWDGTYNGHPLPSTDYWFKLNYTEDGIIKEFKSHFSLKR